MAKKKVHLICNAHLDPIWQWDWQEGAAAAISTFQAAANLADEFDYIFCHNEVVLYQYIEQYAPQLFRKIQDLVKAGKWHIMGGWFLQPDCTMPSGESFVRQIMVGKQYFKKKFGVEPTTAINFDPFGHTRGLVQIISKCGQDSYLFMRPHPHQMKLEDEQFWWEGFDGSKIKVNRTTGYNSPLGRSVEKIKNDIASQPQPVISSLWGVGNHGGGPSRVDLTRIKEMIETAEDVEIVHSTPEAFFAEINPTYTHRSSMYICMPGCYVSMSRLKRMHVALENQLYFAERICAIAALNGLIPYPHKAINSITEDLLNSEFHDVLPGSSVKSGEENGLRLLNHGLLDCEKLITKAFFAMALRETPAKEGDYPIFVFNPHPYELDTDVECELTLADQNWDSSVVSNIQALDAQGNLLTSQTIKEESNLNLDWRKRAIFSAKLNPLSLTRFQIKAEFLPATESHWEHHLHYKNYVYQDDEKYVEVNPQTGLLEHFRVNGVEYIQNAFQPVMFDDNADPWGMGNDQQLQLGTNPQPFSLCKQPSGVFGGLQSVEIIEDGPIFLGIEAFFEKDNSKVQVKYRIYKTRPYVDVDVTVFWQDIDKMLRIAIPVNLDGKYIGQTAFGTDALFTDGRENTSQRFVAVRNEDTCLAVFNNGTYGSRFENQTIYLSLLRGVGYCVHPINDRPLTPTNRFTKRMDQCEHNYAFRLAVAKPCQLERMAAEFNQKPFVQNVFPVASESAPASAPMVLTLDNPDIALVTMKQSLDGNGYLIRLMNNADSSASTVLHLGNETCEVSFGKYEVKTIRYNGAFSICDRLEI